MQKLKIGVLMGGKSIEREVSFNSGRTVCDHLDSEKYDIIPLFQNNVGKIFKLPWRFLHRGKIADFEHRLSTEADTIPWDSLKNHVDFIFNAVNGGYGENGSLQSILEILTIPYLGSKVFTSALGMDKFLQKDFLRLHNIAVPREVRVTAQEINYGDENTIAKILKQIDQTTITMPFVIKPRHEGSSLGISVVFDKKQLIDALKKASNIDPQKAQDVLIEEKIEGMEFSCIIIEDYKIQQLIPLPPTEIVKENNIPFFDYDQKYMPGRAMKFTPARCDTSSLELIQKTCLAVMNILNIKTIGRIDGFLTDDNRIIIIDPNTLAGMAPSSFVFCQAAHIGMGHTQLINHLIETELKNYKIT